MNFDIELMRILIRGKKGLLINCFITDFYKYFMIFNDVVRDKMKVLCLLFMSSFQEKYSKASKLKYTQKFNLNAVFIYEFYLFKL